MDKSKVEEIVEKARALNIMGMDFVLSFSVDAICKAYNGIGPQFLPEKLRNKVTSYLSVFEPAAMPHDLRFEMSDGTRASFDYANCEFFVNCHKCAKAAYPWWSWRRYRAYAVIDAMDKFNCGDPGWRAWIDAFNKNTKQKGNPNE